MQRETNIAHGLRWGMIIGLVYCFMLFLRYHKGEYNIMAFILWTLVGYVIVLILLLVCGITRRNSGDGFLELKDAFQTMFIAVLGFEFFFMAFNFLYLKFINPDFFPHFKESVEALMAKNKMDSAEMDKKLESLDKLAAEKKDLGSYFLSFALSVMTSGIFALIFALIVKRKRDPFHNPPDDFMKKEL